MKFHPPSFLLGVGVTAAYVATRTRLRPVAVELSALGLYLARLGRSLIERQREDLEDLWAEVEERVRERARVRHHDGSPRARAGNGA
jgi:hypothetical protein